MDIVLKLFAPIAFGILESLVKKYFKSQEAIRAFEVFRSQMQNHGLIRTELRDDLERQRDELGKK